MTQDENYLKHYGVKGMKWGVRKIKSSSTKKRSKPLAININVGSKKRSKKDLSDLSYQELMEKVNRLNLEKRYRELTQPQKNAGRKFVEEILAQSGKEVAKKYVTKGMDAAADTLIKRAKASAK